MSSFNSGFWRMLGLSGSVAITLISIALWRRRRQADPLRLMQDWDSERTILRKEKELVEKKLCELEIFLDQMTREIEGLKTSIKEKQAIIDTHEGEKDKMFEHEKMLRKESKEHIERHHRRAQKFLIDLEEKTTLAALQQQHITSMESATAQLRFDHERLITELKKGDEVIQRSQAEYQLMEVRHERLNGCLKHILHNFVFTNRGLATIRQEEKPPAVFVEIHDPKLASVVRSYCAQGILGTEENFQYTDYATSVSTNTSESPINMLVNGANGIGYVNGANGINGGDHSNGKCANGNGRTPHSVVEPDIMPINKRFSSTMLEVKPAAISMGV